MKAWSPLFEVLPRSSLLLALAAASLPAWAQLPLSASATASLGFGKFAAGPGGAVTVSPGGVRTASGGVVLVSSSTGSPAQVNVQGEPGSLYAIQLPADGTVALTSPGGQSMAVKGFASAPSGTGQLGGGGSQLVSIGATLTVGAQQAPGDYSGSFQVLVNYN